MSYLVPEVAPMSTRDIEKEAEQKILRHYPHLLREPGSFPALNFFDHVLTEEYGLDTGVEALSDGVEGMTWPDGRVLVSEETYRGASKGQGRSRFTVVHEAYHGLRHQNQIRRALVDVGELVFHRSTDIKPYLDPEWQANTFAAAVLMPARMVRQLADNNQRLLLPETMARIFQVSMQAAEVRLKKLKM